MSYDNNTSVFLKINTTTKSYLYKMDNLNTLVTNKEIEFAIFTIPEKRSL